MALLPPLTPRNRLLLGLAINGGVLCWLFWGHALLWAGLALSSAALALALSWPSPVDAAEQTPNPDAYWQGFASHVCALLPLWAGHISLGKEQMDDAANRLTLRFDGILRQVGGAVPKPGEHTDQAALAQAESRLKHMLQLLQNATRQQTDLAIHLHTLGQSANTLQNLVRSLISGRQLDGEQSMEQLGSDTLEQLSRLQNQIDKAMDSLAQMAHEPLRPHAPLNPADPAAQDKEAMQDEEAAQSQSLQQALEDILVQLQFQDRVDQILSGVQNDMRRLESVFSQALIDTEQRPTPPDTAAWLEALKNSYTTHEQRVLHSSDKTESGNNQNNITFF
ncbi:MULTISPECIES: hypothetical protein [Chromobacterium]|uniref:Chemotaxis protein n=2 Tax=Chromobacterium TaxID=535 RepID=A0ABS3GQ18_9NEIS|nr:MULTISPECIES: hypothetical protein [Chromobacterium]AXT48034.1 hypothetical protein D1345_18510 [Chromobacterium rhizoryzae]MBK0414997.1 hypothetical protein [Chromobacterium haemolyticum]MBO0416333.1 hypothetical protein [Chromobacterium haemolyticum]MBO0499635.1 hypothetical protein [Chromobacterium haemolyticum]MDH0344498.1 hypothetical protein [Chromobacterium haemolyticum]